MTWEDDLKSLSLPLRERLLATLGAPPSVPALPVVSAAVVLNNRTGALHSPVPILAFDFYPKEAA